MPNLLFIYSLILVLASAMGGLLPSLFKFTHRRIQMTLSLVSGVMLGVALLHMLPHSIQLLDEKVNAAMLSCLCGLLFMFLLIRTFHFHQHDMATGADASECGTCGSPPIDRQPTVQNRSHTHSHGDTPCSHDHSDHGERKETEMPVTVVGHEKSTNSSLPIVSSTVTKTLAASRSSSHSDCDHQDHAIADQKSFSWVGLTIGLALHTLFDGLALAAAYSAERSHDGVAALGTFLAILLHKPLDSLTITSLMSARKATLQQQTIVNLVFALVCPLGAVLFAFSFEQWDVLGQQAIGITLAFSAGVFLCISLGDLLPEVHFHSHDRIWLSLMLLLGVAIAMGLEWLPGHNHFSGP